MLLLCAEHVIVKLSKIWTVQWMKEKFKVKSAIHFKGCIG